ncbi:hypothetical protein [Longimicrobium sp.]|uniref:hypothetical protein n=1 Tax=Longimicrobium sp. TaxID=2029185 RepID=UPI002CB9ED98|nr:hypothetical protein [Longimicrobium sp.]HSU16317.1 hypothetical protein [Longimicrobium sp.]
MAEYYRDVEMYVDVAGRSDVADAIELLSRSDRRAGRAIENRINLLRQHRVLADALVTQWLKQPTPRIYVLRVQSGPVSYRLPFFEAPDREGRLVILTHCVHRSTLRGDRYKALIEAAERRRQDWIRRNPGGE